MYELPLFPLSTVLFPGTPLRLHIFEERYKRMMNLCIEEQRQFGVVLIRKGLEALGPLAEPHMVGCSAKVSDVQRLPGGRMNLTAIGQDRFRVLSLDHDAQPYLIGNVEPYPLLRLDPLVIQRAGKRLRLWLERYLILLNQAGHEQFHLENIPSDPVALAYIAASFIDIPAGQKQGLLEAEDALDLIQKTDYVYRREVALLKKLFSHHEKSESTFSTN